MSRPRILDLFAGCGGMTLGFQNAGYEITAAIDAWPEAVKVHAANFDHPALCVDLADGNRALAAIWPHAKKLDGIIGGPPCQDFSSAGRRSEGERSKLTGAFAEIITRARPKFFVMENVPRARISNAWNLALVSLMLAGYRIDVTEEDAGSHGAPQTRNRAIAFGVRREIADPDMGDVFRSALEERRTEPVSVRGYFGPDLAIEHYYRHPRSYNRRGIFSVDEPSPTIRGVNRPMPGGYKAHPGDTAPPDGVRALTTLERARIQTFPASFEFPVCKTSAEQMIGNAVPPLLAEAVAKAVRSALKTS